MVILAALCACDIGRSAPDPIPECTRYASLAEQCLGTRIATKLNAAYAKPPTDEAARDALREQCVEQDGQLRKSCH